MSRSHRDFCLSAELHENNITEPLSHFLGCVEISERSRLLSDDSHPVWLVELQHQINSGETDEQAERLMKRKREKWKNTCLTELRRIEFLRRKLEDDIEEGDLVRNVEESRRKWQESEEYRKGIDLVREWKKTSGYTNARQRNNSVLSHSDDLKVAVELVEKWKKRPGYTETNKIGDDKLNVEPSSVTDEYKPERDANVPIIQFKDGKPKDFDVLEDIDGKKVWGSFPDQKTTVEHLLNENNKENNILYREKHDKNTIKYFHLPSNNMTWAEEAVSRYFNEDRTKSQEPQRHTGTVVKTEAAVVLTESHWRGKFHEGRLSVNSRFMSPSCDTLYSSVAEANHIPKDIVLFMPYLHWETSRNRDRFAHKIEQIVDKHYERIADAELEEKGERQAARSFLHINSGTRSGNESAKKSWRRHPVEAVTDCFTDSSQKHQKQPGPSEPDISADRGPPRRVRRIISIEALIERMGYANSPGKVDATGRLRVVYDGNDQNGRRALKGSRLGQYLIDAARLFEALKNYRDNSLLERYLMDDAPLHPRRTLDQAYYWTLDTTRSRDKDQVVYRATTTNGPEFHQYDFKRGSWPQHRDFVDGESCRDCSDKIRKVSRVVMVDQLWMWILDSSTIITCFPNQFGASEDHESSVYKSVQSRIVDKGHQQIRSVFELALTIFEECSGFIWNCRRTSDKQPQILQIFSEAIEGIARKQLLARGRLWRWLRAVRKTNKSHARATCAKLADVTWELGLESEIKDILDELGIMIHIAKTHRQILEHLVHQVKEVLDPHAERGGEQHSIDPSNRRYETSDHSPSRNATTKTADVRPWPIENKDKLHSFMLRADQTFTKVNGQIDQLEELVRRADITATDVKDLLEEKQQQASVIQAWVSAKANDDAIEQGRIFTFITITFLPLSFLSSLFGMNTVEFGGEENVMHFADQISYIIGISLPLITVFALSLNWTRSFLANAFEYAFLLLFGRTKLYQLYLNWSRSSYNLPEHSKNATNLLRQRQVMLYSERKWDEFQAKQAKKNADEDREDTYETRKRLPSASRALWYSQSGGRVRRTATSRSDGTSRTASRLSRRQSALVDDVEAAI